jgi:hypothetical protein
VIDRLDQALRLYTLPEERRARVGRAHVALPAAGGPPVYDLMLDEARRANTPGLLMNLNMLINTLTGLPALGAVNAGRASSPARRRCRE